MFAAWLVEENVGFERPETFLAHLPPHRLDAVELGDGWRVVGRMVDAPGGTVRPVDSNVVAHLATQQFIAGYPERLGLGIQQRILDGPERLGHHAARAGSRQAMQLLIDALVLADRLPNDAGRQALDNAAYARRAKAFIEFAPAHHAIAGAKLDEVVVAPPRIAGQRLDPRHFRAHVLLPPGAPGRRRRIARAQGLERATGWVPAVWAKLRNGAQVLQPPTPPLQGSGIRRLNGSAEGGGLSRQRRARKPVRPASSRLCRQSPPRWWYCPGRFRPWLQRHGSGHWPQGQDPPRRAPGRWREFRLSPACQCRRWRARSHRSARGAAGGGVGRPAPVRCLSRRNAKNGGGGRCARLRG